MSFLKNVFKKKNSLGTVNSRVSKYDIRSMLEMAFFKMTIEDVSSLSGGSSIVTGRIEKGTVKKGDSVKIVYSDDISDSNVEGISISKEFVNEAAAGDKVGLLLKNVKNEDNAENKRVEIGCLLIKGYNRKGYSGSLGA
ncbi:MAG: EF-Tu/IF-2/RF-3 family GTPase [Endomicrobia bacterium]|nr:EF-Tu/IF-2/RF-3 family GTPase [Endomicrobiia bacterium]MCL2800036.1 EF-Tu/IF-2/RF-3 family GTPase [Endomicrobiia bacterium]